MLAVDPAAGSVLEDEAIKRRLAGRRPYGRWLEGSRPLDASEPVEPPEGDLTARQAAAGYTREELALVLRPTAAHAHEPTFSMGDDTALPPLAGRARPVAAYLKQRFAQVTNPAIDHLRERRVMSLRTLLGARAPLLSEAPGAARLMELESFFLFPSALPPFVEQGRLLDCSFDEAEGLAAACRRVAAEAEAAVSEGVEILVLSDERAGPGRPPVPALLAVGAVHHRLVGTGLRTRASIVVASDEPRDTHHLACLLGYGADAVCPRLALETLAALAAADRIGGDHPSAAEAQRRFRAALERTLAAHGPSRQLENPGYVKYRKGGEPHATTPEVVEALHQVGAAHALRKAVNGGGWELYERFMHLVNDRPALEPRDLLELVPAGAPVPLEEVEAAEAIVRRFSGGAMSHGALSAEAHELIAVALNRLGARANTGEGGEDPARYRSERNSPIKQIASGRFGVTPEYAAFAEELQIKIAQGSKPGEGGQLPGHKATEEIARLRHTQPGVALISPPPHHDIYSIEDLAQLVFDLKQVNPAADVSVKLVAEAGVGIVAAGVAKALADIVHVAGADEFSFGTALLLAEGCLMVRTCHMDTCPVGIATQKPELRAKFAATPEMVEAYLLFVAEEVRRHLAGLGLRTLQEAVGRAELLRTRRTGDARADLLDVTPLLGRAGDGPAAHTGKKAPRAGGWELGARLAVDAAPALEEARIIELRYRIGNGDRAVGARLGGLVGRAFGTQPPPGRVRARFEGTAGQSFGAFLAAGVELALTGEANDYVGKGMSGGRIVVRPARNDAGDPVLLGNTVLYGATGGELYCAGRAGERLAVRNSGAVAVVEGAGDHACEYMTSGTVVLLGEHGPNLGAGMTGGEVYVHDRGGRPAVRLNHQLVAAHRPGVAELGALRALVERHLRFTGSARAAELLERWDAASAAFWRVAPRQEVATLQSAYEGSGA